MAWVGHEGEAPTWTWYVLSDIPPDSRYLVNGFKSRLRQEAQQQLTGAAATVSHSYVGKAAKDFSHGTEFAGYLTEYCPPEMSGEEI